MAMKTQAEIRSFTLGCVTGIAMVIGCFVLVCEIEGIRWQPVYVGR